MVSLKNMTKGLYISRLVMNTASFLLFLFMSILLYPVLMFISKKYIVSTRRSNSSWTIGKGYLFFTVILLSLWYFITSYSFPLFFLMKKKRNAMCDLDSWMNPFFRFSLINFLSFICSTGLRLYSLDLSKWSILSLSLILWS